MTVTVNKKTKTLKAAPLEDTSTSVAGQIVKPEVIDEYLALTLKIEKHNKKIEDDVARLAEIKTQVVGVVDAVLDATDKVTLMGSGERGLEISAKPAATEITDMEQAKKYLGNENFFKIAKVGITDLKSYLSKPQFEAVSVTTNSGTRRVKLVG